MVTPVILQSGETECGIAALAMIFAFYGQPVSLEKLRNDCGVSRDGCKASTLIQVARLHGFLANAYRVEPEIVRQLPAPVIAWWNFRHYVVIAGVRGKKFLIHDPAAGAIKIDAMTFDKAFTGIIIDIAPSKKMGKIRSSQARLAGFLSGVHAGCEGFYHELSYIFLTAMLMFLLSSLLGCLSGIFTDQCMAAGQMRVNLDILFIMPLVFLLHAGAGFLQKTVQYKLLSQAGIVKSSRLIAHMLKLPLLFYSLRPRSEVMLMLDRIESMISLFLKTHLDNGIHFIVIGLCLLVMFKINSLLAGLSWISSVILAIMFYFLSANKHTHEMLSSQSRAKYYSHVLSVISSLETVKAGFLETSLLTKWNNLFRQHFMRQDSINVNEIQIQALSRIMNIFMIISMLCLGCYQVSLGMLSIGELIQFFSILPVFYNGITQIISSARQFQQARILHARVNDMVVQKKDNRFSHCHVSACKQLDVNLPAIECSQLNFSFTRQSVPVIRNITLKIMPSQHILLTGSTGSGKSALAKLFCGLFQATSGEISLFGRALSDYSAKLFSEHIAFVSQEISLFSGSLYQNLVMFRNNVSENLLDQAIETACLANLVAERGLYAEVREAGSNFSGGERQRIEIARAIIQDTPLLILDEATSALDAHTEKIVIDHLRKTNKTIVFIAHRLSALTHCDQIFVMEKGQIIESGKHQPLMDKKAHYYSLLSSE